MIDMMIFYVQKSFWELFIHHYFFFFFKALFFVHFTEGKSYSTELQPESS